MRRALPRAATASVPAVAASVLAGMAVALSEPEIALAAAAALAAVLAAGKAGLAVARLPAPVRTAGLVWSLLIISTLVWRTRTSADLEAAPLDAAAVARLALLALAGLVALGCLVRRPLPRLPVSFGLLGLYVTAALLGAIASPLPVHALFRAAELAVGLLSVLAWIALLRERAGATMLRLLVATVGAIVALVWIEAVLLPSQAWLEPFYYRGLRYTLQGVLPAFSSNTVGTLGGLLALWGIAQLGRHTRPAVPQAALLVGLVTLAAAQYRTGLFGVFLGAAVILLIQRRYRTIAAAAVLALALGFAMGTEGIVAGTEDVLTKGQDPALVRSLSNRVDYWAAAAPLVAERPLLGWGLNVGTREVLLSVGNDTGSTIHNTWIEAALGAGLVGVSMLALAFCAAVRHAWQARRSPLGAAVLGMLILLLVRSFTGTTAELFGLNFLVFAALALAASQLACAARTGAGGDGRA